MESKYLKINHYQNSVEIIGAGKCFDKAIIVDDIIKFYCYLGKSGHKHLFNVHIDDINDLSSVICNIRKARKYYLSGLANLHITHTWFPAYRGQDHCKKQNTIFIYYEAQADYFFLVDRYGEKELRARGGWSFKEAFELASIDSIKYGVEEYKAYYKPQKVKCIIDGKELWLSRHSINELKKLGE